MQQRHFVVVVRSERVGRNTALLPMTRDVALGSQRQRASQAYVVAIDEPCALTVHLIRRR